jgi:hypothetical protein
MISHIILVLDIAIILAGLLGLIGDMRDLLYRNYLIAIVIATVDMIKRIYIICEFIVDNWICANITYYMLLSLGYMTYIIYDISANVDIYSEYYLRFTILQFVLCIIIYIGLAIYFAIYLIK